jgi:hypothetical protein
VTGAERLLEAACRSGRRSWLTVFGLTLGVFALTAHWWDAQVSDAVAASWPAWQLAHHGTLDLAGAHLPNIQGFSAEGDRVVAYRTMGVVLIAVPLNVVLAWSGLSAIQVGAFTASLVSAIAVANISLVLRALVTPRRAIVGALLLAFGTSIWTVASAELWTHGATALWLSLGLVLLSRDRIVLAGCALAPALLTRPHLSLAIAIIGIWVSLSRRSLRPALALGLPAVAAVGVLVLWNDWYFGTPSISGPYPGAIAQAGRPLGHGATDFAINVAGTLVSGWCGALLYTPLLLALVLAVPAGWRAAPPWVRAAPVGGLAYLAVQLRVDTFTGGGTFYGNRLVIELFVLSTPLAALGYARWSDCRPWRVAATTTLGALSVGIFAVGALLSGSRIGGDFSDWTTWYPVVVVRSAGVPGYLVVFAVLLVVSIVVRDAVRAALTCSRSAVEHRLEVEQPPQDPVDKARRVISGQRPGELDGLVDDHDVRHVVAPQQLEHT